MGRLSWAVFDKFVNPHLPALPWPRIHSEEENKLRWTLQTGQGQRQRQTSENAPLAASNPLPAREQTSSRRSTRDSSNSDKASSRGASDVAREEKRGVDIGDDALRRPPRRFDLDRHGASGTRSRDGNEAASVESYGVRGTVEGIGRESRQERRTRQLV